MNKDALKQLPKDVQKQLKEKAVKQVNKEAAEGSKDAEIYVK